MLTTWINGVPISVPGTRRVDSVSSTLLYVGEAAIGATEDAEAWAIQAITLDASGNVQSIKWALHGNPKCKWIDRASYDYL